MLQNTELWLYISVMSSGSLKIIPKIIHRFTAVSKWIYPMLCLRKEWLIRRILNWNCLQNALNRKHFWNKVIYQTGIVVRGHDYVNMEQRILYYIQVYYFF